MPRPPTRLSTRSWPSGLDVLAEQGNGLPVSGAVGVGFEGLPVVPEGLFERPAAGCAVSLCDRETSNMAQRHAERPLEACVVGKIGGEAASSLLASAQSISASFALPLKARSEPRPMYARASALRRPGIGDLAAPSRPSPSIDESKTCRAWARRAGSSVRVNPSSVWASVSM